MDVKAIISIIVYGVPGLLILLGFIVIEDGLIALTTPGLEFTKLKNPVIDESPFSPALFNQEERQFLINHIKSNIPTEWQGIKFVSMQQFKLEPPYCCLGSRQNVTEPAKNHYWLINLKN